MNADRESGVLAEPAAPIWAARSERGVLGALILDSSKWFSVSEQLHQQDFVHESHRIILGVIQHAQEHGKPMDAIALLEELDRRNQLEQIGGTEYINRLAGEAVAPQNLQVHAQNVRDAALRRKLLAASANISDWVQAPGDSDAQALLTKIQTHILEVEGEQQGDNPRSAAEVLESLIEQVEAVRRGEQELGISTGLIDLDKKIIGLIPGNLLIVAGRPGMGKTSLAMNIVEQVAVQSNQAVLVFSMEMSHEELMLRMLSSYSGVDLARLRTARLKEDEWPKVDRAKGVLELSQIHIDDRSGLTPSEMHARVHSFQTRMQAEKQRLGLIVVDYLQLMRVPGYENNRTAEVSEISRALKELARNFKVPVLAASQLNRSVERRELKIPLMADLRESGSIEQDADTVMLLYRPHYYDEEHENINEAKLNIAKQRNGTTGTIDLHFDPTCTRFRNADRGAIDKPPSEYGDF